MVSLSKRVQGQTMYDANIQWRNRPPDERFLDLQSLYDFVSNRRDRSGEVNNVPLSQYRVSVTDGGGLYVATLADDAPGVFTNWSFTQFNRQIGGPDQPWLTRMPANVSAGALNDSIVNSPERLVDDQGKDRLTKLYYANPAEGESTGLVRAITSPKYGRIYDEQIVRAVIDMNQDGRWVVPGVVAGRGMADMYTEVTSQSTTLYASDRDSWLFLVDEQHPVEVDGELFFKGFIVSNSETGRSRFILKMFLLQAVCMNRIIHNAIQIVQLDFKHTSGAPTKFLQEAAPALAAYAESSTKGIEEQITFAKQIRLAEDKEGAQLFLQRRSFSEKDSGYMTLLAEQADDIGSSGDPTNLWDLVCAGTALAREIEYTDERVQFETQVGKLLDDYAVVR